MSTDTLLKPNANHDSDAIIAYIRTLSDDMKDTVVSTLIEEAMGNSETNQPVPIQSSSGRKLGVFLPNANLNNQSSTLQLTDAQLEITRKALLNPDDTFSMDEYMKEQDTKDQD